MFVLADLATGRVTLVDPTDFGGFHVAVAGGDVTDDRLAAVLGPYGRLDGEHAWIETDAVRALAGEAADDDWQAGFAAMIAYAEDHGFLDAGGTAVRAHLEVV